MKNSSTLTRRSPTLMPEFVGILTTSTGFPVRDANAVRAFAFVLILIPNQATPYEPRIPRIEAEKNDGHLTEGRVGQTHKIVNHTYCDEDPEHHEELALLRKVGFTGFPDDVGNIKHGLVSGHISRLFILHHGENQARQYRQKDQNT